MANSEKPRVVLLAGPNGAGKTTAARGFVLDLLGIRNFVNADTIARGLAAFDVDSAAFAAGRVMRDSDTWRRHARTSRSKRTSRRVPLRLGSPDSSLTAIACCWRSCGCRAPSLPSRVCGSG